MEARKGREPFRSASELGSRSQGNGGDGAYCLLAKREQILIYFFTRVDRDRLV
jgi:hypothetical protein